MADGITRKIKLFRRALKHRRRGAFHERHGNLAALLQGRMKPQWWPFNAPRPRRRREISSVVPLRRHTTEASCYILDEEDFDVHSLHTAVYERAETAEMGWTRRMSWTTTPPSKLGEPTPTSPNLPSIASILTEVDPSDLGLDRWSDDLGLDPWGDESLDAEMSRAIEQTWKTTYKFVRQITPGNQGQVDIYKHKPSGKLTIVKTIKARHGMPGEAEILRDYVKVHRNLIEMQALLYDPKLQRCRVVMEYCSGGDLFEFANHWLFTRNEAIPEFFMLHFIASMSEALGFLHLGSRLVPSQTGFGMPTISQAENHLPLLHRDIKLENIFLRWSDWNDFDMPDIVLGDFGGAALESESHNTAFGTRGYLPPEIEPYMNHKIPFPAYSPGDSSARPLMTRASDVYTFAVTLCYLMLWGNYTAGMDMGPAFQKSNLKNWPLLFELMNDCLAIEPGDRTSTETLLNWAAVIRLHLVGMYNDGVRMPAGSYPKRPSPHEESDDGREESDVFIQTSDAATLVDSDSSIGTIEPLRRFPTSEECPISPTRACELLPACICSELNDPPVPRSIQAAVQPTRPLVEQVQPPTLRRSSTARKQSVLHEIIERMMNSMMPNNRGGVSMRESLPFYRRLSRAAQPALDVQTVGSPQPLSVAARVSKFSEDTDDGAAAADADAEEKMRAYYLFGSFG